MKIFKSLMISIILMFLLGCNKNEENIFYEGNIVGFVTLMDGNGYILEDKSGVNISIEGLSHSAISNEDGRFEIANVPAGTYNIIYSKIGFGIYKIYSYQFIGGNIPALLNKTVLFEKPNIELKGLDISIENNIINITGEISETDNFRVQTFLSDSSDVSNVNYDYSIKSSYYGSAYTEFNQDIYIYNSPYSPGDKVYLVLYFVNPFDGTTYYDYENGKSVYGSSVKASNAIRLIIE